MSIMIPRIPIFNLFWRIKNFYFIWWKFLLTDDIKIEIWRELILAEGRTMNLFGER